MSKYTTSHLLKTLLDWSVDIVRDGKRGNVADIYGSIAAKLRAADALYEAAKDAEKQVLLIATGNIGTIRYGKLGEKIKEYEEA